MEKRGLKTLIDYQLNRIGKTIGEALAKIGFSDEMRLGLLGQVRRVLAPRGVKVVQTTQREYKYQYLLLVVLPAIGQLMWSWIPRMKQEHLKPILEQWALQINVWDGAGVHRGSTLSDLPGTRIIQPAYSPELNPAERVFEEVRRAIEGKTYPSLEHKRLAAEQFLTQLAADSVRVQGLCFWPWIQHALCVTSS